MYVIIQGAGLVFFARGSTFRGLEARWRYGDKAPEAQFKLWIYEA